MKTETKPMFPRPAVYATIKMTWRCQCCGVSGETTANGDHDMRPAARADHLRKVDRRRCSGYSDHISVVEVSRS